LILSAITPVHKHLFYQSRFRYQQLSR